MNSRVIGLYTAATAGAPIVSRTWVDVLPGAGIVGDRYARGQGHWSDPKWPDQELTMLEAEVAEELAIDPAALRRNVVTRDVRLDALTGARFQIGGAVLEGVRPCDPCQYLETLTRSGIMRALVGRGGLRVRVITSGRICVGDAIVLVPASG
ncbi:MAG: MOSC domain-containing protein [Dehalococcoidia bacterium]